MSGNVRGSAGGYFELAAFDTLGVQATVGPYLKGSLSYGGNPAQVACFLEIGVDASVKLFLGHGHPLGV